MQGVRAVDDAGCDHEGDGGAEGFDAAGHDTAINDIVEWTLAWRRHDAHWPPEISFEQQIEPDTTTSLPDRTAWCSPPPGHSVAASPVRAPSPRGLEDFRRARAHLSAEVQASPQHMKSSGSC
ncbi:hypothetical protein [Streptomyces noursei]|uniref:hypothetical protein n=1 Tax=Streptomyces noursei TaxID=1971 RepID=UPI000B2DA554|nr:hypothetical protein [Streptomyces noursei]